MSYAEQSSEFWSESGVNISEGNVNMISLFGGALFFRLNPNVISVSPPTTVPFYSTVAFYSSSFCK